MTGGAAQAAFHPEAAHFHDDLRKKTPGGAAGPMSAASTTIPAAFEEDGEEQVRDAALSYLEAMAGFMGFVEGPKEIDPEVEGQAALAFLETLWDTDDHQDTMQPEGTMKQSQYVEAGSTYVPYHEVAASFSDFDFASTVRTDAQRAAFASTLQKDALKEGVEAAVASRAAVLQDAEDRAQAAEAEQQALRRQIEGLRAEIAETSAAVPPAPERLARLSTRLQESEAALEAQNAIVDSTVAPLSHARAGLAAAELERDKYAPVLDELERELASDVRHRLEKAAKVTEKELRAAHGYAVRKRRAEASVAEVTRKEADKAAAQLAAARSSHKVAMQRLREGKRKIEEAKTQTEEQADESWQRRAEAVMALKESIAGVYADITDKVELYRAKLKAEKERNKREFNDLLEAGKNPYEVARRRKVVASVRAQKLRNTEKLRAGRDRITQKLVLEEQTWRQQLQHRDREQAYEEAFQKEMGVATREKKVEEYMLQTTKAHIDMLDPTSRLPVAPSDATVSKTWDFGLGRARPDVLDKVKARHDSATLATNDALIPRHMRDDAGSGESGPAMEAKAASGAEGSASVGPELEVHAVSEFQGTWEDTAPPGRVRLYEPNLSKFERDAMARAALRHKQSMLKAQTFGGKEFKGPTFIPTPAVPTFKDFTPGETYKQKVVMTNVSLSRCTFKVKPLPDEYADIFTVDYSPPGYVSAGMTCDLHITFRPRLNTDIVTAIPLLAETGLILVPLECYTKKVQLTLDTHVLDFGDPVTLGENTKRTLTLSNAGALQVSYVLAVAGLPERRTSVRAGLVLDASDRDAMSYDEEMRVYNDESTSTLEAGPFTIRKYVGRCPGYGSIKLHVDFAPVCVGEREVDAQLTFKADEMKALEIPAMDVHLQATGGDVPMKVLQEVIDYNTCVYNTKYRDQVVVSNSGSIAMKASLSAPPAARHLLEITPSFGYVQAGATYPFCVTLRASTDALTRCSKLLVEPGSDTLEIPLRLDIPAQVIPVDVRIRARLTTPDIVLSPLQLDFGHCIVRERTAVPLSMHNTSVLTQTFGFLELPRGVAIEDNGAFGTILPGATVVRHITFTPEFTGPQSFDVKCTTLFDRVYTLHATADAVTLPLAFSHNRLQLAATPVGCTELASTALENHRTEAARFEFAVPEGSGLRISPRTGTVEPGAVTRIQVSFVAPVTDADFRAAARGTSASGDSPEAAPEEPVAEIEQGQDRRAVTPADIGADTLADDGTRWRRCARWSVPCFVLAMSASAQDQPQTLHLNVDTCVIRPYIVLEGLPFEWTRSRYMLAYGPMSVGEARTVTVQVKNLWSVPLQLTVDPLDPIGAFEQVTAARTVPAGATAPLKLAFRPPSGGDYWEVVRLRVPGQVLELEVSGSGITPRLTIESTELQEGGACDLGDVAVGDVAQREFTLRNTCPFALSYRCVLRGLAHRNVGGLPAYYTVPESATIASGESSTVKVVFQPDWQGPYFDDILDIVVPYQSDEFYLQLRGRGWAEGVFLRGPRYRHDPDDPFKAAVLRTKQSSGSCKAHEVQVVLPDAVRLGEKRSCQVEVCSLKDSQGAGAPGEITFEPLADEYALRGWSVDNLKMAVNAGEAKPITITYAQAAAPDAASAAAFGQPEFVECVLNGVAKGGLPAPAQSEGTRYRLIARAWVVPEPAPS